MNDSSPATRAIYAEFRDKLVSQTRELNMGDPKDRDTFIGPMISEAKDMTET